ncbi:MAG: serine hydrolase [Lysobacteraceae bacterium]
MDDGRRRFAAGLAGLAAAAPVLSAAQGAGGGLVGAAMPRRNTVLDAAAAKPLFDAVFAHLPAAQRAVLEDPRREVQIALTRIDRDAEGTPTLSTAYRGLRPKAWFPAASTVKLPAALLLAETLEGAAMGFNARSVLDAAPATGNWSDAEPQAEVVWSTLWRLLVISENPPFNRVFDLLGPDAIQERLEELGFGDVRLIARLGSADAEANRRTAGGRLDTPVIGPDGEIAWDEGWRRPGSRAARRRFPFGAASKAAAWRGDDGRVVTGPRDFSWANYLPVADAHAMLRRLLFPERVRPSLRWRFSEATRLSLLRILGMFPRESPLLASGTHAPQPFGDGYAKFFVVGDRDTSPSGFRSFGKTGEAFGHQSETALLTDADGECEVLLSANVYANADGILNDDAYEYDTVSRPFLAALGRAALAAERERPPRHRAGAAFLPRQLGFST